MPNEQRLVSLDALRGFTMFWIVGGDIILRSLPSLHNNPVTRALAAQGEHVEWAGLHWYDVIFPLFLFIIGVTLPFSYGRRLENGGTKRDLYKHIFIRTVTLFVLGLIFYGFKDPDLKWLGYYGVLQLLAVGYFFASIIMLNTSKRGTAAWVLGILLFYYLLMRFGPVPGHGTGLFTPEGNFNEYISKLAADNIGQKWRIILSPYMIPTPATALLGVLAGYWLRSGRAPMEKFRGLLIAGAALIPAGLAISLSMPVIKNLWSVSYVLLTAGISSILLGLFYWLIDIAGHRRWAFFFVVIGMNPITIYMLARLVDFRGIAYFLTQGVLKRAGTAEEFLLAVSIAALQWLVAYWLYRRKIFIKI